MGLYLPDTGRLVVVNKNVEKIKRGVDVMNNSFGIPEEELSKIRLRDKNCVYCHKKLIYPFVKNKQGDCATIEHLNCDAPFDWSDGLRIEDIAICCGSCNSSRGPKRLLAWFRTKYCMERGINEDTVADPVKKYLERKKGKFP